MISLLKVAVTSCINETFTLLFAGVKLNIDKAVAFAITVKFKLTVLFEVEKLQFWELSHASTFHINVTFVRFKLNLNPDNFPLRFVDKLLFQIPLILPYKVTFFNSMLSNILCNHFLIFYLF